MIEEDLLNYLMYRPRSFVEIIKALPKHSSYDIRAALMALIITEEVEWSTQDRRFKRACG